MEQCSHAGSTPCEYTPIGKELVHTDDSSVANKIYNGTLDHEALKNEDRNAIVIQLIKNPAIHKIISPIFREEDFKSSFKCVPEKTTSSYSGRGVHH
jgi:hypothetical protein